MPAANYDLTIEQGATYAQTITWKDSTGAVVNLTGYTARMQVRSSVAATDVIVSLTTENGGITLGGSGGTITLSQTAAQTAAITALSGVYDLELITAGGLVTRLMAGNVTFSQEVTR